MTSTEIKKLRLGSIIAFYRNSFILVGYHAEHPVLVPLKEGMTKEDAINVIRMDNLFYASMADLTSSVSSYMGSLIY